MNIMYKLLLINYIITYYVKFNKSEDWTEFSYATSKPSQAKHFSSLGILNDKAWFISMP